MRSLTTACLSTAALLIGVNLAAAQTTFKYKFEKGQKLHYVVTQDFNVAIENGGKSINFKTHQIIDETWEIKKVANDGSAEIARFFTRYQLEIDSPDSKFKFDTKSDKDPEDAQAKRWARFFRETANEEMIGMRMNSRGKISNVTLSEKVTGASKDVLPMTQFEAITALAMIIVPDKALEKNDSWKGDPFDVRVAGFQLTAVASNQFDGAEKTDDGKDIAKFTRKLQMEPKPNQPISIKIKSQDANATAIFDIGGGRLASAEIKQKMVIGLSPDDKPGQMNVEQTTRMKLVK